VEKKALKKLTAGNPDPQLPYQNFLENLDEIEHLEW
jgi:hypothetical protein